MIQILIRDSLIQPFVLAHHPPQRLGLFGAGARDRGPGDGARLALAVAAVLIASPAGPALALGANFRCGDGAKGSVRFPSPQAAVVTVDGLSIPMHIAASGSGSRYVGGGLSYWEHQGTVTIKRLGRVQTCKIVR